MKKLVSIILVLALCLSAVAAFAEAIPSKTTGDLVSITTNPELIIVIDSDNEWALEELEKLCSPIFRYPLWASSSIEKMYIKLY